MSNQKILNMLGLATRARKIILGEEFVLNAMKRPDTLVFIATDAGANITKKINNRAITYNTQVINHFTSDELSHAIGKNNRKVLLLEDKGFITKINEYLNA